MDQELLVDPQIEDGRTLIADLERDGLPVFVAFWVKVRGEETWNFYIGVEEDKIEPPDNAPHFVYVTVGAIPDSTLTPMDINFVDPTDPIAIDAIRIRDRYPARLATRYRGKRLGDLAIDEAYIYPSSTGLMSPDQVAQAVAGLMGRPSPPSPSIVTLRDGTRIDAVPVGMERAEHGGVRIVLRDLNTGLDRSIPANEVASIL